MATMHYVACTWCRKEYYLERNLSKALAANPMQRLKCPFCKREFHAEAKKAMEGKA